MSIITAVLVWCPCLLGLPEISTAAHVYIRLSYGLGSLSNDLGFNYWDLRLSTAHHKHIRCLHPPFKVIGQSAKISLLNWLNEEPEGPQA